MSERIPGIGALTDVPRAAPNPSFEGLQLQPEDWFVLSRVDGNATLRDILTLSPKSREETVEILKRLHQARLLELPGVEDSGGAPPAKEASSPKSNLPPLPDHWPVAFADFAFDEALLARDIPMDVELRKRVMYYHAHLDKVDHYAFLGVAPDAKTRQIRRQYFKLSKAFHPDRFFRQDIGEIGEQLRAVFRHITEAQSILSDADKRKAYDARLAARRRPASRPTAPVRRQRRPLSELLGTAKAAEKSGDFRAAFEAYEAALEQRASPELMNRSAECLIRLREDLDLAETRARSAVDAAPDTARYWVALAYIQELRGQIPQARQTYHRALELDPGHSGARTRLERLPEAEP